MPPNNKQKFEFKFASFAVIVCSRKKPGLFAFYCQQVVQIL